MRVIVMADDLTGANAVASLLRREGLPSWTHLLAAPEWRTMLPGSGPPGAHVLSLDTRNVSGTEAARRLAAAASGIGVPPDLLGLRIDSTLRGPIAASIEAVLGAGSRLALVVPAYPASGRTTKNGVHYLRGSPVARTELAHDPESPVILSNLAEWIGQRTHVPHANLILPDVRRGWSRIVEMLSAAVAGTTRIIFCDAETDDDIEQIARGALELSHRNPELSLLPVDPGPFTAALVRVMQEPMTLSPQIFGVMCSVMPTASEQMDFVEAGGYARTFRYTGQSDTDLLAEFLALPPSTRTILLRTDTLTMDVVGRAELQQMLLRLFPRVVAAFPSLHGLFLSGGETAAQLLGGLGVRTLALRGEVAPLTSLSRIADGALRGMMLVTKGGSVGKASAVADLLGYLSDTLTGVDSADDFVSSSAIDRSVMSLACLPDAELSTNQKVAAI